MHRDSRAETAQGQQGSAQSGSQGKSSSKGSSSAEQGGNAQGQQGSAQSGDQGQGSSSASQQGATSQTSGRGQQGTTSQTGQANANADLSTEQRTRIREIVLNRGNAPRMARANFPVSVGTVVPSSIRFVRLPARIARIYPEWRDYDYVMVRDRILIIDPVDRRIVAVLES
jgi:hypothetical protein